MRDPDRHAADDPPAGRRHRPGHGIGLVTVVVPDYDEAIAFYVDAVGFDLVEDTPLGPVKRWVVVAGRRPGCGPAARPRRRRAAARPDRRPDRTRHLDADHVRMRAAGVRFLTEPRDEPYGRVAVFADPWGNRWDLLQPAG